MTQEDDAVCICASSDVAEGGLATRFEVQYWHEKVTAFVVRYDGKVRAYINRCAHVPTELDWQPGHVFDEQGLSLVCSVHMASYDPATGDCIGGPCNQFGRARGLQPVTCFEADGSVYWQPTQHIIQVIEK